MLNTTHTARCSNLELHWIRLWEARAHRVSDGVQSKILMCALENSNDLKTSSIVSAISKWRMRKIVHRKMLQSRAALKAMVKLYSPKSGRKYTVLDDAHRCYLVLEPRNEQQWSCMSELKTRIWIKFKMLQPRLTLNAMVRSSSAIGARLHNAIRVIFLVASIW